MSVTSEADARRRATAPTRARMHPLFVELFIDPPDDDGGEDQTRRARARRARKLVQTQAA